MAIIIVVMGAVGGIKTYDIIPLLLKPGSNGFHGNLLYKKFELSLVLAIERALEWKSTLLTLTNVNKVGICFRNTYIYDFLFEFDW